MQLPERIAILIPCYNECKTIAQVVADFYIQLPSATVYVYDNGSQDDSAALAEEAGAIVKHVPARGKGHVVRRMFADVDADIYVMVDGDATYDVSSANRAIELLQKKSLDMVICTREPSHKNSFRLGHSLGNKGFNKAIKFLFGYEFKDVFSGYRIFSRRFVKSFPAISQGFDIEAEISIHSLQIGAMIAEIETPYKARPLGSISKLRTIRDGGNVLRTILLLFMYIRPMALFGFLGFFLSAISIILLIPIIIHYFQYALVPRIPTLILAVAIGMMAGVSLVCGIILDSISRARLEAKRFWYLMVP